MGRSYNGLVRGSDKAETKVQLFYVLPRYIDMFLTKVTDNCPLCDRKLLLVDQHDALYSRLTCKQDDHEVWTWINDITTRAPAPDHLNIRSGNYHVYYEISAQTMSLQIFSGGSFKEITNTVYFVPKSKEDFLRKCQMIKVYH